MANKGNRSVSVSATVGVFYEYVKFGCIGKVFIVDFYKLIVVKTNLVIIGNEKALSSTLLIFFFVLIINSNMIF